MSEPGETILPEPGAEQAKWWTAVVERYIGPICRYVRARVPADCTDDIVQDVFVAAAGSARRFDPERGSVWQWLVGIARRKIADHYRRDRRPIPLSDALAWFSSDDGQLRQGILDGSPLPDEACQRAEFRALARAALSTLEPRRQACLVGRYYEGFSLAELAERLNVSRSAVNSLLYRARQELREAFLRLIDADTAAEEFGQ